MRESRFLIAVVVLSTSAVFAEQSDVNVHLEGQLGGSLPEGVLTGGGALKVDTTLLHALGPVAPQLEVFGLWAPYAASLSDGSAFGIGLGARLRLFNDEKGYFYIPGSTAHGAWWGNAYVDAHVTWSLSGLGAGFDVSAGAEFSVVKSLSVGPFVKYALLGWDARQLRTDHAVFGGLAFTLGLPPRPPADADDDGDGIVNKEDRCTAEAEDKDGFEDADGCPDLDNDHDGVPDEKDQCPLVAEDQDGFQDADGCPDPDNDGDSVLDAADQCPLVVGPAENMGCPDTDADKDGVVDRLDQCRDQAGPADNHGCPDPDGDGDTVVDRLDACPAQAGANDNKGCPWPDADGDGVPDRLDNCPSEKGAAENQGCPKAKKQLVELTPEKLVIKEKIFFTQGKAAIQARSNALLDQIASVLAGHAAITLVQIEGHTDSSGNAEANRKLSADRAAAVKAYLVKKKIAATRLRSVGFGPDRPAESNDTEKGREANRRVEFNIVEQ